MSALRNLLLVGVGVLAFATPALAEPPATTAADVANYSVQKRCGDAAYTFFQHRKQLDAANRKTDGANPEHETTDYENNYSAEKNGCFILITHWDWSPPQNVSAKDDPAATHSETDMSYFLYNVSTNHLIGWLAKTTSRAVVTPGVYLCEFEGVECKTEDEWWAKAAPYIPAARSPIINRPLREH